MTSRRRLLSTLGAFAASAALGACGPPQVKVMKIGLLPGGAVPQGSEPLLRFREDLRSLGWVEGENLAIEFRFAGSDTGRLPALVAELLRQNVDVLVVGSTPAALAAKAATSSVPIVFTMVSDPVASGVVADLARPAGNVTGTSNMLPETSRKLLELLEEVVPRLSQVAVLHSPDNPGKLLEVDVLERAARQMGVDLQRLPVRGAAGLARALAEMPRAVDGVVVLHDQVTAPLRQPIVQSFAQRSLPAIYQVDEFVDAGGLMSYGVNVAAQYRRSAAFVDKILRGARPGELAVEQPTVFDFVVNLGTAKALGIAIPASVAARATRIVG